MLDYKLNQFWEKQKCIFEKNSFYLLCTVSMIFVHLKWGLNIWISIIICLIIVFSSMIIYLLINRKKISTKTDKDFIKFSLENNIRMYQLTLYNNYCEKKINQFNKNENKNIKDLLKLMHPTNFKDCIKCFIQIIKTINYSFNKQAKTINNYKMYVSIFKSIKKRV